MARPTVPDVAEQLYGELGVTQPADEALGWPFLIFLAGLAAAMGELPPVVHDDGEHPGWSSLLDPVRAPGWALPWLAQFAGVRLTPGLTDDEHRDEITSPPAFRRGTPAAMTEAAQRFLTGEKRVTLREQDGSAYLLTVVTYDAETPDADRVEAAVRAQKPAGLILIYEVHPGWSYADMAAAEATYADAASDFATYADLTANLP